MKRGFWGRLSGVAILFLCSLLVYSVALYVADQLSDQGVQTPASLVEPSPDEEVARLNGMAITAGNVSAALTPARTYLDASIPTNPRAQALDRVVRARLFAEEAARRGIEVPEEAEPEIVEAVLAQSLTQEELEREGVDTTTIEASITDEEVSAFYEEQQSFFEPLESVELYAVVVEDPELTVSLLEEAKGATNEEFTDLVSEYSVDRASRKEGGYLKLYEQPDPETGREAQAAAAAGEELAMPSEIDQVGRQLLEPGRAGLARGEEDGRYYVLRSGEVTNSSRSQDAQALRDAVRAAIVEERQQKVIKDLQYELLKDAELAVDKGTLYRLSVPDL